DYPSLGFVGDVVKVKPGFARNFLYPKKIAIPVTTESMELFEHRKRQLQVKKAAKKKDADVLKTKIDGTAISLEHAATADNKLFGSVTLTEIHDKLKGAGIELDRKLIRLEAPIKAIGVFDIEIKLHQEVSAHVKLTVTKKADSQEEKEAKKLAKKSAPKKVVAQEPVAEEAVAEVPAEEVAQNEEKKEETA
ncbi:50S ribosomal protein L9, partial [bacterium]|nr:50S ribosomal protein L9 [bacterium]MBU1917140.1 50S ribosomal protein L9 [bacterium]